MTLHLVKPSGKIANGSLERHVFVCIKLNGMQGAGFKKVLHYPKQRTRRLVVRSVGALLWRKYHGDGTLLLSKLK
jgi:hypothetical protein